MTVQEQINGDLKIAMKEKNEEVKNILRVVIGEFNRVGKDLDDEKATSIIKKMADNASEQDNEVEAFILEAYLPTQMDELELKRILMNHLMNLDHKPTMKDMGGAMAYLKNNYGGQYDGKLASTMVKELINM